MTVTTPIRRMRRLLATLVAAAVLATTAAIALSASPASADTRYERVLVEENCGYETQYAKVQTPEQAAAGTYTMKPTLVWTCTRVYDTRAYRHSHWYHGWCPALAVGAVATGGTSTAAASTVTGAGAITCIFSYSHI